MKKSRVYCRAGLLMWSMAAQAHYSFAIYDSNNRIDMAGVLMRIE